MFLVRCAFWLSVVYASMSWGGGALSRHGAFEAAVAEGATRAGAVTRAVAAAPVAAPLAAAVTRADAAAMAALVRDALRPDEGAEEIVGDAAPLPPPAPRRGAAPR